MTDKERDALHAAIRQLTGLHWDIDFDGYYVLRAADGEPLGYVMPYQGETQRAYRCRYYGLNTTLSLTRNRTAYDLSECKRYIEQCWFFDANSTILLPREYVAREPA